jgi:hypothetical protein
MKWTKFTEQKPKFGTYCLCKKNDEDGDGGFVLFIARYIGMPRRTDYWTHDGIMYDKSSVDYWMDACALDKEASK